MGGRAGHCRAVAADANTAKKELEDVWNGVGGEVLLQDRDVERRELLARSLRPPAHLVGEVDSDDAAALSHPATHDVPTLTHPAHEVVDRRSGLDPRGQAVKPPAPETGCQTSSTTSFTGADRTNRFYFAEEIRICRGASR